MCVTTFAVISLMFRETEKESKKAQKSYTLKLQTHDDVQKKIKCDVDDKLGLKGRLKTT